MKQEHFWRYEGMINLEKKAEKVLEKHAEYLV